MGSITAVTVLLSMSSRSSSCSEVNTILPHKDLCDCRVFNVGYKIPHLLHILLFNSETGDLCLIFCIFGQLVSKTRVLVESLSHRFWNCPPNYPQSTMGPMAVPFIGIGRNRPPSRVS